MQDYMRALQAIISTRGLDVVRSDEFTVGTWAKTWFEIYAKPNIRPSTADYYNRFIESYIVPQLGHINNRRKSDYRKCCFVTMFVVLY